MKTEAAAATSLSQALTQGTCPVCAILKDFQWTLAESTKPQAGLRLGNFHVWALARSRDSARSIDTGERLQMYSLKCCRVKGDSNLRRKDAYIGSR